MELNMKTSYNIVSIILIPMLIVLIITQIVLFREVFNLHSSFFGTPENLVFLLVGIEIGALIMIVLVNYTLVRGMAYYFDDLRSRRGDI